MILKYKTVLIAFFFPLTALLAQQWTPREVVTVQIKNEAAVNTEGLDFSPTFYEDGIVFISTNTAGLKKEVDPTLNLSSMSILRSGRNAEGELMAPQPFAKELSTLYHQGPVCFDRTAETVYFSSNVVENGKEKAARDGSTKMRLYSSVKYGETWSAPKALPFNNGEFDDQHPAISIDGDKLFFSSNRPGGLGGMDIYVSYRVGDSWSEPVNLGSGVNTTGHDAFPFIHADNTLMFASTAQEGGLGGFDLYYVIPEGNEWTKPINMGAPFNTSGDDFGLIVDLNKINGYFNSNGSGGKGGDEIFSFRTEGGNLDDYLLQNKRVPDRELDVKITVTDKATSAPLADAAVQLIDESATNIIGRDDAGNLIGIQQVNGQDVIRTMPADQGINGSTDSKGRFSADLKPGTYVVIVARKGYQSKQLRLPINKPGNEITVALEKIAAQAGKVQWNASVFNYVTNAPMTATTLVLTNPATGQTDTVFTDAGGLTDYYLNRNTRYQVQIIQAGRMLGTTEISTEGGESMIQNISVAPLLPGTVIELPNIYYNFNDATLRPDSRKDLNLVTALMQQHPGITVEMASHTDSRGSEKYNRELSQRRAEGVVNYLVSTGINRQRLQPVGYGESQPRNSCQDGVPCTEQEHSRNRRTEIRIITGVQGASVIYVDGEVPSGPASAASASAASAGRTTKPEAAGGPVAAGQTGYHVVAGSFLMESRAHAQAATVQQAGFEGVQVVQFDGSPFYSVSVGRFNTRAEAQGLHRRLKNVKIDAFVRSVTNGQ
jgi:outer membrane protein OmpA-like peptidoglycan-associated protein